MSYLATADDSKIKAVFTLLEADIKSEPSFILSDEQLAILDKEHELHIASQTKSYSRGDAIQIIKGLRSF